VQWGSKSSQTGGIVALPQIEQPQRHEEGCNEGFQFVARISGDAIEHSKGFRMSILELEVDACKTTV
jgi:hypothetical protein